MGNPFMHSFFEASNRYIKKYGISDRKLSFEDPVFQQAIAKTRLCQLEKKQQVLSSPTDFEIFYVFKGVLRIYKIEKDGTERVLAFIPEGEFGFSWKNYLLKKPDDSIVEALSDSTVVLANYKEIEGVINSDEFYSKLYHRFWMTVFVQSLDEMQAMYNLSIAQKYDYILKNTNLSQLIPKKYIASYLGTTPETLSRVSLRKN